MWETLRILDEEDMKPLILLPMEKNKDWLQEQLATEAILITETSEAPSEVFRTIHIQAEEDSGIQLGGRDLVLRQRMNETLTAEGFDVSLLEGEELYNSEAPSAFCNDNERGKGVFIGVEQSILDEADSSFLEALDNALDLVIPEETEGEFITDAETWRDWHEKYFADQDSYLSYDGERPERLDPGDEGEEVQKLNENLERANMIHHENTGFVGTNLIPNTTLTEGYDLNGTSSGDTTYRHVITDEIEAGEYTISFNDFETDMRVRLVDKDGEDVNDSYNAPSPITFQLDEATPLYINFRTADSQDLGTTAYTVEDIQLKVETGDQATAWIQAVEDFSDQYDTAVEDAVYSFQEEHDLYVDGIAGEETMGKLMEIITTNGEGINLDETNYMAFQVPEREELEDIHTMGLGMERQDLFDVAVIMAKYRDKRWNWQFQIYKDTETEEQFAMLHEINDENALGWGTFAWHTNPTYNWCLDCVHTYQNINTSLLGARLFAWYKGHRWFMNGTDKLNLPEDQDNYGRTWRSDCARNDWNPFHAFVSAGTRQDLLIIEPHGFGWDYSGRSKENYVPHVLSDSDTAYSKLAQQFAEYLTEEGIETFYYDDTQWQDLGAQTNRQGHWTNARMESLGIFQHWELESHIRWNRDEPDKTDAEILDRNAEIFGDGLAEIYGEPEENIMRFNTLAAKEPMVSPQVITYAMTARFQDGDTNHLDITFNMPVERLAPVKEWETDRYLSIQSAEIKDAGYRVECQVTGSVRARPHRIVPKGEDAWGREIYPEPVYAEGISGDEVWSGEDNLSEMDYRPYPTFPTRSVFDTVGINGSNFTRTKRFHPRLPHQRNGAVMMVRKRSPYSQWTWQGVTLPEALTDEGWFRTYVYFPKDHQQRASNMIFGRLMVNEDNLDGIRLYLSSEQDEEYGDRYYLRINDGQEFTQYPSEARLELGRWHCVEIGMKGIGTTEGVSELWLNGEKIGELANDYTGIPELTFSRVGVSFVSVVDERYEFYMDGVKIGKSRFGTDEQIDRIMPPMPNYIQEEQWNIGRFFLSVPVHYSGLDVRVRARVYNDEGQEIDSFVSSYQPQGQGNVEVAFSQNIPSNAEMYVDATDGEIWSSVYRFDVFNVVSTGRNAQDKNTTYVMHFDDELSYGEGVRQGSNSILDDWKYAGTTNLNGKVIATETILTESLNVLARERVNNFTRTGTDEGWTETTEDTDFVIWESNSRDADVARVRTDGDGGIESNLFMVDPNTTYEIACSLWCDHPDGKRQVEIKFYDANKDLLSSYESYDPENREIGDKKDPFYLFEQEGSLTGIARGNYMKLVTYFVSSEVDSDDTAEVPMGENSGDYAIMPYRARYAQLIFHSIENSGNESDFYIYSPTVHNVNAGTFHAKQVTAGKFSADRLDVLAKNKINNFTKTGEDTGWSVSTSNDDGTMELIEDDAERNGATLMRLQSDGDLDVWSEYFEVDPSTTHKLNVNIKCEAEDGSRRVGIIFYDKNEEQIGNISRWSPAERGGDGGFTDTSPSYPYFVRHSGPLSDLDDSRDDGWIHVEAIFAQSDLTNPDEMPYGMNARWNFVMPDNARYARIRFLSRSNGGTQSNFLIHSPVIENTDDGYVRANKVKTGELQIGGEGEGNASLGLYDNEGDQVAEMTAKKRGFRRLTIEDLESESVVNVKRYNQDYYVDVNDGSDDENDGESRDSPVQQIMQIVRNLPRYLERNVAINVLSTDKLYELLDIRGFMGPGSLTINLNDSPLQGGVNIWNCNLNFEVNDSEVIDDRANGSATVWTNRSLTTRLNNVMIQTRGQRQYGFRNDLGTVVLDGVETYGAERGLSNFYGGQMTVMGDCKGLASDYGIYNYGGSVYGEGTAPDGETAMSYTHLGGWYEELHEPDPGEATKPEPDEIKRSFEPTDSNSWRDRYSSGWRANDDVYQGEWNNHGLHTGFWFFGGQMSEQLEGRKIKSARMRAKRQDYHGYSSPVTVVFRTHTTENKPSGSSEPWTSSSYVTADFDRDQTKWVDLDAAMISNLERGHEGIAIYTSYTSSSRYAIMHPDLLLEVIIDNT